MKRHVYTDDCGGHIINERGTVAATWWRSLSQPGKWFVRIGSSTIMAVTDDFGTLRGIPPKGRS